MGSDPTPLTSFLLVFHASWSILSIVVCAYTVDRHVSKGIVFLPDSLEVNANSHILTPSPYFSSVSRPSVQRAFHQKYSTYTRDRRRISLNTQY